MAEEAAIRGASAVTVARVIARAGVSRRLFYELFADVEDCLLASLDRGIEQARVAALVPYLSERGWRAQIRAALAALLRFFDEQPLIAQLCVVHAAGGGTRVLERRAQTISELCEVVDRGRLEGSGRGRPGAPGPVVAEGVVGAVLAVLYARLLGAGSVVADAAGSAPRGARTTHETSSGRARGASGTVGDLPVLIDLHGELMSMIVLPYLGPATAAKELHREPPPPPPQTPMSEPAGASPTPAAGARLTYRTVRVLRAIAELPAASNREVAERAGIVDQGQISKVLTRLEAQGLLVNRGGTGPARGTPNSWWLTERGEALERELREHPAGGRGVSGRAPEANDRRRRRRA